MSTGQRTSRRVRSEHATRDGARASGLGGARFGVAKAERLLKRIRPARA